MLASIPDPYLNVETSASKSIAFNLFRENWVQRQGCVIKLCHIGSPKDKGFFFSQSLLQLFWVLHLILKDPSDETYEYQRRDYIYCKFSLFSCSLQVDLEMLVQLSFTVGFNLPRKQEHVTQKLLKWRKHFSSTLVTSEILDIKAKEGTRFLSYFAATKYKSD